MEIFTARQPIFNKGLDTIAYEILFRSSNENFMPQIDGDVASSSVLSSTYLNIGLEQLTGGKKAFINFTENLLLKQIPLIFPKESIVVEILEDVRPSKQLIEECTFLKDQGYTIALDDFEYRNELIPLINIADIIKFDFRLTPIDEISEYLNKLNHNNKKLLAEKIETESEFKTAMKMGFHLFQGYFFCKPQIVKGQDISTNKVQILRVIAEINDPEVEIDKISELIQHDVGLSYKVLRYINSAYYRRLEKISSIRDAAVIIGLEELRKLASIVVLSQVDSKKQSALLKRSSIRAKFCELIGVEINNPKYSPTTLFTLGLFSHIDALLGYPMNRILQELPLSKEITEAFLFKQGPLYPVLLLISLYEGGSWENVIKLTAMLNLSERRLTNIYLEACKWTDQYFTTML